MTSFSTSSSIPSSREVWYVSSLPFSWRVRSWRVPSSHSSADSPLSSCLSPLLRAQSNPEVHSPEKEHPPSIHRGVRRAPTAPNASTLAQGHGFLRGQSGTRTPITSTTPAMTPYNNGDENFVPSRMPFKDLLFRPKKKLASDANLTWRNAGRNVVFASWLNVMVSRSTHSDHAESLDD